jgi:hypothetical protein
MSLSSSSARILVLYPMSVYVIVYFTGQIRPTYYYIPESEGRNKNNGG